MNTVKGIIKEMKTEKSICKQKVLALLRHKMNANAA